MSNSDAARGVPGGPLEEDLFLPRHQKDRGGVRTLPDPPSSRRSAASRKRPFSPAAAAVTPSSTRGLQTAKGGPFASYPRPARRTAGRRFFPEWPAGKPCRTGTVKPLSGIVEDAQGVHRSTRRAPATSFQPRSRRSSRAARTGPLVQHPVDPVGGFPTSSRKSTPAESGSYGVREKRRDHGEAPPASTPTAAPPRIRSVARPHGSRLRETSRPRGGRRRRAPRGRTARPRLGRRHRAVKTRKAEPRGEVRRGSRSGR